MPELPDEGIDEGLVILCKARPIFAKILRGARQPFDEIRSFFLVSEARRPMHIICKMMHKEVKGHRVTVVDMVNGPRSFGEVFDFVRLPRIFQVFPAVNSLGAPHGNRA